MTVLFAGSMMATDYKLVTSVDDLEADANYIIGNAEDVAGAFMSTATNNNNRKRTDSIDIAEGQLTATAEVLVLQLGGEEGKWTFLTTNYMGTDGYLANATSGTTNACYVQADACEFTIAFDENKAVITSTGGNQRNTLRYNNGSSCFACYAAGNQKDIYLFKEIEGSQTQDPVIIANNIDFGTVYIEADASEYVAEYTLHVTGQNLTDVILVSGSDHVAVSETSLPAAGGSLTLTISAPVGNFAGTVGLASSGLTKTVNITGVVKQKEAPIVLPEGAYILRFNGSGSTSDASAKLVADAVFEDDSKAYVESIETVSNLYAGRQIKGDNSNTKFGTSGNAGELAFTLKTPTEVEKIVFCAAMYGDNEGGDGFIVNETETFTLSAGNKEFEDCEWKPTGTISAIDIKQAKASGGRFYLRWIIVYPKASNPDEPAISANDINLGEVTTENDVYHNELELTVQAQNLTEAITFVSSNPDVVAVTGTLDETGGTLTVTIDAPASVAGLDLDETITLTSGEVSKVIAVTALVKRIEPQVLESGYYLIGPDWTKDVLNANVKFDVNPANADEFMLTTTLVVDQQIKVVEVASNEIITWYPDGEGNEYVVDADHAGEKTIYFRPDGQGGDDWYYGYFFIAANEVPPTPSTDPYTLTFNGTGSEGDSSSSYPNSVEAIFTEDCQSYVASVETASNIYAARIIDNNTSSLKFGTSSKQGELSFTLATPTYVESIVVNATQYGNNASEITINGSAFTLNAGNKKPQNCEITPEGLVSTITITQSSSERLYLRYITITPKSVDPTAPVIAASNIALGDVTTPNDVYHVEKELTVTGQNLTEAITFVSSNPDVVAVAGTLDETGGTLTVTIDAPASVAGLDLDETITLTSGEVSKVVSVTAHVQKESVLANGYYLIGQNGWDVAALSANLLFVENTATSGEYMLTTTLAENDEIKVVRVENDAIAEWFPGGDAANYVVDAAHAGEAKTIYFKPSYQSDWAAFGGYFFIEANPVLTGDYFVKVTETPADWSGDYLIVYEAESVAFDGSLETLDAAHNTIDVTIENESIAADTKNMNSIFTIAAVDGGGYSIKAANGKYIGVGTYSNGLKQSDNVYVHNAPALEGDDNHAILSISNEDWAGDMILNFNSNSSDKRFRYYKNGSQKVIALYKLEITPVYPTYYLKNNWGEGIEWTWKETTRDEEGIYHLPNVVYGGTGINFNTVADDEGAEFIEHNNIQIISSSKAPAKLLLCDTVNLSLDPNAKTISAQILNTNQDKYTVMGSDAGLFFDEWQEGEHPSKQTDMTKQEDGTYAWGREKVILFEGIIELQVVKNHDKTLGCWPAEKYQLSIPSTAKYNVTITFNPSTKEVNATADWAEDINFMELNLKGNWDWSEDNLLLSSNDEKYKAMVFKHLSAGDHQFKLVNQANQWFGDKQKFSRGNSSIRNIEAVGGEDNNMILHADVEGDYLFIWEFETNHLIIQFPSIVPDKKAAHLKGKFSVSATQQINFSRGNLQYNYGAEAWYFAENQYERLGDANNRFGENEYNGTKTYTGSIDLFGWSSAISEYGLKASALDADFTGNFEDWGGLFTTEDPSREWRTLSKSEWNYLMNRTNGWTMAALGPDSILGLILFPDEWTAPEGITIKYAVPSHVHDPFDIADDNLFTFEQWASLEANGAVFLPVNGERAGNIGNTIKNGVSEVANTMNDLTGWYCWVSAIEYYGMYWLSSTTSEKNADYVILPAWSDGPSTSTEEDDYYYKPAVWSRERRRGNSVRLVANVVPPTYTVAGGSTAIFATAWDATDTNFDMTLQADGTYQLTLSNIQLGVGTYEYEVDEDHMRYVSYPVLEGDLKASFSVDRSAIYDITFIYYPAEAFPDYPLNANCEAVATPVDDLPSAQIKGSWEPWVTPAMTLGDGNATATYTRYLDAGKTYTFTIISNGDKYGKGQEFSESTNSHDNIEKGSGMKLHTNAAGDYTFTWTFATQSLEITFPSSDDVYNVIGSAVVFGVDWAVDNTANAMVLNPDGTYSYEIASVELSADVYEYRVVKNHDWDGSYPEYDNATFPITESGKYSILFTLDPTNPDHDDAVNAYPTLLEPTETKPTVQMKGSWDNWDGTITLTQDNENEASWTMKMTQSASEYQFKMLINGNYRSTGGTITESSPTIANIVADADDNMKLSVPRTGNYTFTWEYATNSLTVTYPGNPTAVDDVDAETKAMKVLREGNLFIIKGDKIFNAQGMMVK